MAPDSSPRRPGRRRIVARTAVLGTALIVAAGAGGAIVVVHPFDRQAEPTASTASGISLAAVREGALSSQINESGTLSYLARPDGTPYALLNWARGIYTSVPSTGDEIGCGQTLYQVDGRPVVLLCGKIAAYRDLSRGDSGDDVRELNQNLVKLGYADSSTINDDPDYFGRKTATALKKLQDAVGADDTGRLKLGDAVFLPQPLRIVTTTARPGGAAMPGSPFAEATATGRQVIVDLDASQQADVTVGDRAQITLPGNRTTSARVSRIGRVAKGATIPIYLTLSRAKDVAHLDQAPVQVQLTTDGVRRALIVPVTALLGQAGGGYAVERVGARGVHQLVPVALGLFDNADGLVQVSNPSAGSGGLAAGDEVVVPNS